TGTLPLAPDGRIDVYRIAGPDFLRSARSGCGPTPEEVRRGDYAGFPYKRFRGKEFSPYGDAPLLWDREAGADGTRLVAFANGTAAAVEEAALRRLLRRHGQLGAP
ncbi:MAG: hypothetical protein ACE5JG_03315, partial [Planctomycetota bacterium]